MEKRSRQAESAFFSYGLKKGGVSTVVATVLLVLLVVAAVAILWANFIPDIDEDAQEASEGRSKISIETADGQTYWDPETNILSVQVKRGNDGLDMTGLQFVFFRDTKASISERHAADGDHILEENSMHVYTFNLSDESDVEPAMEGKPERIRISPFLNNRLKNVVSDVSDVPDKANLGEIDCCKFLRPLEVPGCDVEGALDDCVGCSNECAPSESPMCEGDGVKTCGDYDSDTCLEWSGVVDCTEGETCSGGICSPPSGCVEGTIEDILPLEECGSDIGVCTPGHKTQICIGGIWQDNGCEGGSGPKDRECNGFDDNCDGEVDNDPICDPVTVDHCFFDGFTGGFFGLFKKAKYDPQEDSEGRVKICTCEDLAMIGKDSTTKRFDYVLNNSLDCSETVSWNGGDGFDPIGGDGDSCFKGTFNGSGRAITDLTIDRLSDDQVGLFGCVDKIIISDVFLKDVDIKGDRKTGGLIGEIVHNGANNNYISNVYVSGRIESDDTDSTNSGVGGLVGDAERTEIQDCHSSAEVIGRYEVGGLVGDFDTYSTMHTSSATGDVTAWGKVGGLVGEVRQDSEIFGSYATGDVTVNGGTKDYVGGFVGRSSYGMKIYDSFATGNVFGGDEFVGGFAGLNDAVDFESGNSKETYIKNSFSTGRVEEAGNVSNYGSFIGYNNDANPNSEIVTSYVLDNGQGWELCGTGCNDEDLTLIPNVEYFYWNETHPMNTWDPEIWQFSRTSFPKLKSK